MRYAEAVLWGLCLVGVAAAAWIFWLHIGTHDTAETNWLLLGLMAPVVPFVAASAVGGIRRAIASPSSSAPT